MQHEPKICNLSLPLLEGSERRLFPGEFLTWRRGTHAQQEFDHLQIPRINCESERREALIHPVHQHIIGIESNFLDELTDKF